MSRILSNDVFNILDAHVGFFNNIRWHEIGVNQINDISEYFCDIKRASNPTFGQLTAWATELYLEEINRPVLSD